MSDFISLLLLDDETILGGIILNRSSGLNAENEPRTQSTGSFFLELPTVEAGGWMVGMDKVLEDKGGRRSNENNKKDDKTENPHL